MGRFNDFHADVLCPSCGKGVAVAFQADVGALDWSYYQVGDLIALKADKRAPIGPEPDAWDGHRSLWGWALGHCPACRANLDAKVFVVDGHYAGARLWPDRATGDPEWGYLEPEDQETPE